MKIEKLETFNWNDFVSLMQTDSQCAECYCLNHRMAPGCPTGEGAKREMANLVEKDEVGGLLAYLDGECIGWISVDPMTKMIGHDCQKSGKANEWAIHCIYVRGGHRGKGLSVELIRAAIAFAKENGAQLVSAFPIPTENREKFPVGEAEFSGRLSTYSRLGFVADGESSAFYQRMELTQECHRIGGSSGAFLKENL